jgi:hypothetical protein
MITPKTWSLSRADQTTKSGLRGWSRQRAHRLDLEINQARSLRWPQALDAHADGVQAFFAELLFGEFAAEAIKLKFASDFKIEIGLCRELGFSSWTRLLLSPLVRVFAVTEQDGLWLATGEAACPETKEFASRWRAWRVGELGTQSRARWDTGLACKSMARRFLSSKRAHGRQLSDLEMGRPMRTRTCRISP